MSDQHNHDLTPDQRRAQTAVRGLGRPVADADFRARLKADFVSGALAGATDSVADVPGTGPAATRGRARPLPLLAGGLALAAVAAALMLWVNPLPGPRVALTNGKGAVVVDGRSVPADRPGEITRLLHPGARVEVRDGASVDIYYPGSMVWRLASGTVLRLPERPGRFLKREVDCAMDTGEISVRTGPDFGGNTLVVATGEGRAIITGTLVSVVRNEDLTCVCLFEGHCRIVTPRKDLGALPVGKRWVMYRNGNPPDLLDIAPPHLQHMMGLDRDECNIFTVGPPPLPGKGK